VSARVTSLRGLIWEEAPPRAGGGPLPRLLAARGWTEGDLAGSAPADPMLLPDMPRAVARLRQAAAAGERVLVFGDYDTDGLAATALMVRALRALGAAAEPYVPGRLEDGYGLNVPAIAAAGASLVVAVDNGTTACAEAAWCQSHGVDLVVLDHHRPGPERPQALAVVNPHLAASRYPFRELCGAAVAWRAACALGRPPEEDIDLVATATVADVVPLLGENRTIVREGLRRLERGRGRPGLHALLAEGPPSARDLAFRVAPRLNAPGRMGDAGPALRLLLAEEGAEVAAALDAIEAATRLRREAEAAVAAAADAGGPAAEPLIFRFDPGWHVGVLGPVAGRLAERSGVPVFLCGRVGQTWRGSARAPAGHDVTALLSRCAAWLGRYGGHAGAAGFECADPAALADALRVALREAPPAPGQAGLRLDGDLLPGELTLETALALEALEPHGEGNPPPRLLLRGAAARQVRTVGQDARHLKLTLNGVDAIGFELGFAAAGMEEGSRWDACVRPRADTYRGRSRLQLEVEDLRPAGGAWAPFLAAFPDRAALVEAYRGLRAMAARGPLPPLPVLPLGLSATAGLPLPTARAAAAIFRELGVLADGELRSDPVELASSPSFRLACQVRARCRAIIR
jgi:single-stranded-DNA-specific exonuclease